MSEWLNDTVCYLHIPKTGGNWVREVIQQSGIQTKSSNKISKHGTYDLLVGSGIARKHPLARQTDELTKFFCVVRHPLTWYESWFNYQHTRGWLQWGVNGNCHTANWHCLSPLNMPKTDDFNEYMQRINTTTPGFLTYLYHAFTLPSAARVLKNEQLREDLLALNGDWQLGLNESLIVDSAKINVSNKTEIVWSEENLAATLENEQPLLKKYGYAESPDQFVQVK